VVSAGRTGGEGIMVRLKHANAYETYYLHLSRPLVRTGQVVQQGQTIGWSARPDSQPGRISISACAVLEAL